jgi:hypothetical protein
MIQTRIEISNNLSKNGSKSVLNLFLAHSAVCKIICEKMGVTKMKEAGQNRFYHGNIDATISSVAECCPEFFDSLSILITGLDSSDAPALLTKWSDYIFSRGWEGTQLINEKYVYIPEHYVKLLFEEGKTFFHFDEVFLLDKPPERCDKEKLYISERYDFSTELPDTFVELFIRIKARRFLSDGVGLNYACLSREEESILIDKELILRNRLDCI